MIFKLQFVYILVALRIRIREEIKRQKKSWNEFKTVAIAEAIREAAKKVLYPPPPLSGWATKKIHFFAASLTIYYKYPDISWQVTALHPSQSYQTFISCWASWCQAGSGWNWWWNHEDVHVHQYVYSQGPPTLTQYTPPYLYGWEHIPPSMHACLQIYA